MSLGKRAELYDQWSEEVLAQTKEYAQPERVAIEGIVSASKELLAQETMWQSKQISHIVKMCADCEVLPHNEALGNLLSAVAEGHGVSRNQFPSDGDQAMWALAITDLQSCIYLVMQSEEGMASMS